VPYLGDAAFIERQDMQRRDEVAIAQDRRDAVTHETYGADDRDARRHRAAVMVFRAFAYQERHRTRPLSA